MMSRTPAARRRTRAGRARAPRRSPRRRRARGVRPRRGSVARPERVGQRDQHVAVGERSARERGRRRRPAGVAREIGRASALLERGARRQDERRELGGLGEEQFAHHDERHRLERSERELAIRPMQHRVHAEERERTELPVARRAQHRAGVEPADARNEPERLAPRALACSLDDVGADGLAGAGRARRPRVDRGGVAGRRAVPHEGDALRPGRDRRRRFGERREPLRGQTLDAADRRPRRAARRDARRPCGSAGRAPAPAAPACGRR